MTPFFNLQHLNSNMKHPFAMGEKKSCIFADNKTINTIRKKI